ncbi:hypothetical protein, unlikely [Trypanosoma congolense IL3000]|uniref:Uncharacterized protein n=1 Tax=Trypanosoma congolense (strain IL3000) TaxID=1068625 RepID=F9WC13_TRYCI|nr:hypothetical protein, unlikely [Trypanosoma congolense IL3000]
MQRGTVFVPKTKQKTKCVCPQYSPFSPFSCSRLPSRCILCYFFVLLLLLFLLRPLFFIYFLFRFEKFNMCFPSFPPHPFGFFRETTISPRTAILYYTKTRCGGKKNLKTKEKKCTGRVGGRLLLHPHSVCWSEHIT